MHTIIQLTTELFDHADGLPLAADLLRSCSDCSLLYPMAR
jgi:hypothetical protein